jgi:hypothetical protein
MPEGRRWRTCVNMLELSLLNEQAALEAELLGAPRSYNHQRARQKRLLNPLLLDWCNLCQTSRRAIFIQYALNYLCRLPSLILHDFLFSRLLGAFLFGLSFLLLLLCRRLQEIGGCCGSRPPSAAASFAGCKLRPAGVERQLAMHTSQPHCSHVQPEPVKTKVCT